MGAVGVGELEGKASAGVGPDSEGVPRTVVDRGGLRGNEQAIIIGRGTGDTVETGPGEVVGEENAVLREAPGLPGLEGRRALGPDRLKGKKEEIKNKQQRELWMYISPKSFHFAA